MNGMTQTVPPGWYADPSGQPGTRWWDGAQWTDHTQPPPHPFRRSSTSRSSRRSKGSRGSSRTRASGTADRAPAGPVGWGTPQGYQPPPVQTSHTPDRIQRQVREQAKVNVPVQGGGTLFTEPVLVVNQKTKLIELTNEYAVFDQHGKQIGSVVQVGQSALKKAARFLTSVDQFLTHRLEVRDTAGVVQLVLTRPAKFVKSKVIVSLPDGTEIGKIVQQNVFGKIRFELQAGGQSLGMIKAENWRAWNFSIVDHTDTEVARVTKTWEGSPGRCSPRPTTTSCRFIVRCRSRCSAWSSPRR